MLGYFIIWDIFASVLPMNLEFRKVVQNLILHLLTQTKVISFTGTCHNFIGMDS